MSDALSLDYSALRNLPALRPILKQCAAHNAEVCADPFFALPFQTQYQKEALQFARERKNTFKNLAIIGIGGSSLGAHAAVNALLPPFLNTRLFFFESLNFQKLTWFLKTADYKNTLFLVISKSGETIETLHWLFALAKKFKTKEYKKHFVCITGERKNTLRNFAEKYNTPLFLIPENLSGRFSVLSHVGLLPCALLEIDIHGLLRGARKIAEEFKVAAQTPQRFAALQYLALKKWNLHSTVLFPYGEELGRFVEWAIQLYAESLGKSEFAGITPLKSIGSTDQHSLFQLYAQGPRDKFIVFIRKQKPENEFERILQNQGDACAQTLAELKRPCITLHFKKLNAETLGALFMLFEIHIALLGRLLHVNPFDQPAVELLKQKLEKSRLQI